MSDRFQIPVVYIGEEVLFNAELINYGYFYKIQVDLYGTIVLFERDDENNFRAIMPYEEIGKNVIVDLELLKCISTVLGDILC